MAEDGIIINGEILPIIPKYGASPFGKFAYSCLIRIEPAFLMYQMAYDIRSA